MIFYEIIKIDYLFFCVYCLIDCFITKIMENRYNAKAEVQSISSLLHDLTDKHNNIDLDPPYQRNVIWNDEKKQYFIDSVMKGIIPQPIIFNICPDGKKICIDGKQRLTSLKMFYENKICWHSEDEKYYYDDNKGDKSSNKLTVSLLNVFRNAQMQIIKYENLSYSEQRELFNRIQNGMSASTGELYIGCFPTEKSCESFKKYCNGLKRDVKKFIKDNRGDHYTLFLRLSFLMHNGIKSYSKKTIDNFIRDTLDDRDICDMLSDQLKKIIKNVFTDEIFNHDSVDSGIKNNVMIVILYFLYKKYKNNYNNVAEDSKKIRSAIIKICENNSFMKDIKSDTTEVVLKKIENKYASYYKKYVDFESESDSEVYSDSSSESDKKPKKTVIKSKYKNKQRKITVCVK